MSWAIGYDSNRKRDIGYGVPAICDYPGCNAGIHRGLSYVCGGEPYGGGTGCGLFFCGKHLAYYDTGDEEEEFTSQLCTRCGHGLKAFDPKPDTSEWIAWKLTDISWEEWRAENPEFVKLHSPTPPQAQE